MDRNRGDTHKAQLLRKWGLSPDTKLSMNDWSRLSGIDKKYLQMIFNRGVGAHRTNPASVRIKGTFIKSADMNKYPIQNRLSAEQWGWARIASFVNKGPTYYSADSDIARMIKK